jgi:iron complex outermembrane recepter protein
MKTKKSLKAFVGLLAMQLTSFNPIQAAESASIQAPSVPITGNPLGAGSDELVVPVYVLSGRELSIKRESTIGETLTGSPGVSSSYFGPNASRPIIRGMDGDRIRIMQNGVGALDASSLSPDHAVAIDPLIAEQIEVIRGPATVLYGAGSVGGVVNVIDHRIPKEPLNGVMGRGETRFGGADNERSGAAVIDMGNGMFAIHADVYTRKTDDLSIPSSAQNTLIGAGKADHVNNGKLANSAAQSDGGAFGASLTFDKAHIGASYSEFNNLYGTVAEPTVKADMRSKRWDFSSEAHHLDGFIERIKFRAAFTDYKHQEISNGEIGTTFLNKGVESTLEVGHAKIDNLSGVVGLQTQNTRFSALGDEAFVPSTHTSSQGVYLYEELPIDRLTLSAGGRIDETTVKSAGGGAGNKFGDATSKQFSPKNLSAGALFSINESWSVATNLTHTERAPTQNELFSNGPHVATNQYEIGLTQSSMGLAKVAMEKANGIDAQIRWKTDKHSFSLGCFYNKFDNFINIYNTGRYSDKDGNTNSTKNNTFSLAEAKTIGVPATFTGIEAQGKFRIYEGAGDLDLNMRGDYVRATNDNTDTPLSRIAPMRIGTGLDYKFGDFASKIDVLHGFKQDRVATNELPTNGYTLVNATISYRLKTALSLEAFAKVRNLLDEDIRDHSSFLKEIAPMGGRSVLFGLRGEF